MTGAGSLSALTITGNAQSVAPLLLWSHGKKSEDMNHALNHKIAHDFPQPNLPDGPDLLDQPPEREGCDDTKHRRAAEERYEDASSQRRNSSQGLTTDEGSGTNTTAVDDIEIR